MMNTRPEHHEMPWLGGMKRHPRSASTAVAILLLAATLSAESAGKEAFAVDSATFAYVTNTHVQDQPGTVSMIDMATKKLVASPTVGRFPVDVTVTPNGNSAYVTNNVDGSVSVIDSAQQGVATTILDVATNVGGVVASPTRQRVYVADSGGGQGVVVIDTEANAKIESIGVGGSVVRRVAVTPDGDRIYAATASDVSVININADEVYEVGPTIPAGTSISDINMSRDGRVYVAGIDRVVVIDSATNTVVATLPIPGGAGSAVPSTDGSRLYVAATNSNQLWVFETSAYQRVETVVVGTSPQALAVTADGKEVVVANAFDDTATLVKISKPSIKRTIAVGDFPTGVAIG